MTNWMNKGLRGLLLFSMGLFEVFNFASTEFSLADLTGGIEFWGVRWATLIALAFCGVDFAGVARIFTPETGKDERKEVIMLYIGWLLAAVFNALLSWWGILQAMLQQGVPGNEVINHQMLVSWFPSFAAILILLIRFLLVGSIVTAFDTGPKKKAPIKTESPKSPQLTEKVHERPKPMFPNSHNNQPKPAKMALGNRFKPNDKPDKLFGDLIDK